MTLSARPQVVTTDDANFQTLIKTTQIVETVGLNGQLVVDAANQVVSSVPDLVKAQTATALTGVNSAIAAAQAAQVTDKKFISSTTAFPVAPTGTDLTTYPGDIFGSRLDGNNAVQRTLWDRGRSLWVDNGAPLATRTDTDAAKAVGQLAQTAISYASKAALSADSALPSTVRAFTDGNLWDFAATGTVDGGRVIAVPGGVRVRAERGGARPEWYGAVGDGVTDDTTALSACINGNALTLLRAGATYKYTAPITASNVCRIVCEGITYRQPSGFPDDATTANARLTRLLWAPSSAPTAGTASLTLVRASSSVIGVAFDYVQPVDSAGWTPTETGWAVAVQSSWCTLDILVRGFTQGIRGGVFGTMDCAGLAIPNFFDGTYKRGIYIEQATDVVHIGRVFGSIIAEPNNFSDINRIKYRLANHQAVTLKRCDNPVIDQLFSFLSYASLVAEGGSSKVTVNVLEADECLYGYRQFGQGDLYVGTFKYQRTTEGGYATGGNPAGVTTGTQNGRAIDTTSGASGLITVGAADFRNSRGGQVYLDGAVTCKLPTGKVWSWAVNPANTEACYSVANAGGSLSVGETMETSAPSNGAAQLYALTPGATLHATATGTATPGTPTIAAGATYDFGVVTPGSQPGMTVAIGASGFINDGITAQGVAAAGTTTVRLRNNTAASIVLTALTWRVTCKS